MNQCPERRKGGVYTEEVLMKWLGPPRPRTGCCPPGVTLAGFRSKVTPESDLDLVRPLDAFLPLTRLRFTDSLSLSPVRRDTTSFL